MPACLPQGGWALVLATPPSRTGRKNARDYAYRRFSGPVRAQKADNLPWGGGKRDPTQRMEVAVPLVKISRRAWERAGRGSGRVVGVLWGSGTISGHHIRRTTPGKSSADRQAEHQSDVRRPENCEVGYTRSQRVRRYDRTGCWPWMPDDRPKLVVFLSACRCSTFEGLV